MSQGLYSGVSGLALGTGLYRNTSGLWSGASGLAAAFGAGGFASLALDLNLLSGPLDPRITFSRGSQATLTDSTGKITYAPNNLLTNSESFEAAAWVVADTTVASNFSTAPNGSTTADRLTEAATTAVHAISQTVATLAATNHVFSVYLKKGSGATAPDWVQLTFGGASTGYANFNISTGAVGVTSSATASISSVGSGWYRCSIAVTVATAGSASVQVVFTNNTDSATRRPSYAGATTSDVLVWGAQLEQVTYQTTPGTYNSTTPKNLLGYTQEFDNAAWTKSNAFVQTNLLVQSQAFNNVSWLSDDITTTDNSVPAPFGTALASTITETLVSSDHRLITAATPSFTAGQSYTLSIYVKNVNRNFVQLGFGTAPFSSTAYANFDISTGVLGTVGAGTTATITAVGGGWYRCSIAVTAAVTTTASAFLALVTSATAGRSEIYTGTGLSVNVFGAQLVQGATAGNYQPTYAAAAAVQYPAPDGSTTADKLVEAATTGAHYIGQNLGTVGVPETFSFYAKAAERGWATAQIGNNGVAYYNLSNGTLGSVTGGTAAITSVGNGWYRCSITATRSSNQNNLIYPATANGTASYTGDGTSGIYVWGAQLSNSASLDPYVYNPGAAPTSAAYYGPRFDYNPVTLAAKGLLIEEQRTNLLLQSQDWSTAAWSKPSTTVTTNAIPAPDGTLTGNRLLISAPTTITQAITATATSLTYSIYVKLGSSATTGNSFIIRNGTTATNLVGVTLNYATGVASYTIGTSGASVTDAGNGWWRLTLTVTSGVTVGDNILVYVGFTGGGVNGEFLYAWGAQVEAGAFATSYIPTGASTVTRSADVATMTGANFSNWYNQNEGSFSIAVDSATTGYRTNLQVDDGTLNNRILIQTNNVATAQQYYVVVGGSAVVNTAAQPYSSAGSKTSATYKLNDYAYSVNGTAVTTDTSATVPAVNRMFLGTEVSSNFLNGHIRSISYYNTRLVNADLQTLTAPTTTPSLSLDFMTQVFNVG